MGAWSQNSSMQWMGAGQGAYEREVVKSYTGYRCRPWCLGLAAALLLALCGFLLWYFWPQPPAADDTLDCETGYHDWERLWTTQHKADCCSFKGRGCHSEIDRVVHVPVIQPAHDHFVPVPVPSPPHIVYKNHYVHLPPKIVYEHEHHFAYDCDAGYSNWYFGWSAHKKSWCCDHTSKGCPGSWHGSYHVHTHVFAAGVGHAEGRIYDCNAGFSNWMQGWSDSKKDWCCTEKNRGCVQFHCNSGAAHMWSHEKSSWCCSKFQKGCPRTTLSSLKCDALCDHAGETSKCIDRIHWTKNHVFGSKANSCELAYSKVQVECDICRACSIQEAGCEVHAAGKDPFDCDAALSNFFRAWSPSKKHWCCTQRGKGCEGSSPPAVDAGFGMVWKHVQVNGYWTWQAVHAAGGVHVKLPYDCHAGLHNWHIGWSAPKKTWCCGHQQLGCEGAGGAAGGAGAGGSFHSSSWHSSGGSFHSGGSYHTHVVHHYD